MTFDELGLAEPILRAVAAEGYTAPTPIQSQAIPRVMSGRDVLGCAQTGTGKTAAFALPILHRLAGSPLPPGGSRRPIRVLVLAPTRELAMQIGQSFRAYGRHTGLRNTVIVGGVGQQSQRQALQRGVDILIATPGRLIDLMGQGFVDLDSVEMFVLDEADRMLDMGFIPDIRRIVSRLPSRRQTILFSATMPETIERLAAAILRKPAQVRIAPVRATTELIEQSVAFVPRQSKTRLLVNLLRTRPVARALVFTRTKHGADRLARQLHQSGIGTGVLHGNKSQSARQRTLEDFKAYRTAVLVATDLAARGIDVEGISHVLNFDLPHEAETYVHRIGRTGRAGVPGVAISFCDEEERKHLAAIERLIRQTLPVEQDLSMADSSATSNQRQVALGRSRPHASTGRKHVARSQGARKRKPGISGKPHSRENHPRTARVAVK
jgi:ATP-dependent RNA helicase RhlE